MTTTKHINDYNRRRKELLVKGFGGKCQICGYDKCITALEFHHINPELKDITLSSSIHSWEKTKNEIKKCICVCANCHREIHEGLINVEQKQYFDESLVEDYDPRRQNESTRFKQKFNWENYDIKYMHDIEHKTFNEIAKIIGCSESHISKRYKWVCRSTG